MVDDIWVDIYNMVRNLHKQDQYLEISYGFMLPENKIIEDDNFPKNTFEFKSNLVNQENFIKEIIESIYEWEKLFNNLFKNFSSNTLTIKFINKKFKLNTDIPSSFYYGTYDMKSKQILDF